MTAVQAFGLEFAEWGLIVLGVYFALDVMGLSRGSRTIRRQNHDLKARNDQLENDHVSDRALIGELREKVAVLETQVAELQARDQGAVLNLVLQHEHGAIERHTKTLAVLVEIRDTLRERAVP